MAARRSLFTVGDTSNSNDIDVLEGVLFESSSDNEDCDPSYVPQAASSQESPKTTLEQAGDSSDDSTAETGDTIEIEGLSKKRRVVNKASPKKGRRRQKGLSRQEKSKAAKNQGKSYRTYRGTGPPKSPRKPGPNCNCRLKCFTKICETIRANIFEEFNAMGDYNTQNAYLFGLIDIHNTARKTKKTDSPSRRSFSVSYNVLSDGIKVAVCKIAFLSIHGLQKNRGRLEVLVSKKAGGISTPPLDRRGKHGKHLKKYTEDDINTVNLFIDELPKYESHYSRHKNPYKHFMSMEYTVVKCFEQYKEFCSEKGKNPVSSDKFRRIFTQQHNIGFKQPKSDTCKDCDCMRIELEQAKLEKDDEKIKNLSIQLDRHHVKAAAGQQFITNAPKDGEALVLTFDLQQALPTPKLSTNPAFYKRKLFCYNLGIHDCSADKGYFYYWDETTAKRGSDEIASCILKHFTEHNIKCKKLIVISDNCAGQNKNWALVSLWLSFLASGRVSDSVEHVFPVVGHTMLPCDRDFGRVGNYVRDHVQYVYSPDDWGRVLQQAQKKFFVYRMVQQDFFKVSALKEFFTPPVGCIASATKIKIEASTPGNINFSKTYFGESEEVSIKPKGRRFSDDIFIQQFNKPLQPLYRKPIPVQKNKKADVMSLLKYVPEIYHAFYQGVSTINDSEDN